MQLDTADRGFTIVHCTLCKCSRFNGKTQGVTSEVLERNRKGPHSHENHTLLSHFASATDAICTYPKHIVTNTHTHKHTHTHTHSQHTRHHSINIYNRTDTFLISKVFCSPPHIFFDDNWWRHKLNIRILPPLKASWLCLLARGLGTSIQHQCISTSIHYTTLVHFCWYAESTDTTREH